jgi:hypothetical protein
MVARVDVRSVKNLPLLPLETLAAITKLDALPKELAVFSSAISLVTKQ